MSEQEYIPHNPELDRLRRMARMLDSAITLPGGFRIGLDGLVGLIPGIGDAIGATAATYIVIRAAQMGASTTTLIRMMWNIVLETLVGAVPILGDLFDFAWKANNRNIRLLEKQHLRASGGEVAKKRLTSASLVLIAVFVLVLVLLIVGAFQVLLMLLRALGA